MVSALVKRYVIDRAGVLPSAAGVFGSRIYSGRAPRKVKTPHITIEIPTGSDTNYEGAERAKSDASVLISFWCLVPSGSTFDADFVAAVGAVDSALDLDTRDVWSYAEGEVSSFRRVRHFEAGEPNTAEENWIRVVYEYECCMQGV